MKDETTISRSAFAAVIIGPILAFFVYYVFVGVKELGLVGGLSVSLLFVVGFLPNAVGVFLVAIPFCIWAEKWGKESRDVVGMLLTVAVILSIPFFISSDEDGQLVMWPMGLQIISSALVFSTVYYLQKKKVQND